MTIQYSRFGFVEKTNGNKLKTNFEIDALRIENRILIRAINPSSRRDGGHVSRRTKIRVKPTERAAANEAWPHDYWVEPKPCFEAFEGSGLGGSESVASA